MNKEYIITHMFRSNTRFNPILTLLLALLFYLHVRHRHVPHHLPHRHHLANHHRQENLLLLPQLLLLLLLQL